MATADNSFNTNSKGPAELGLRELARLLGRSSAREFSDGNTETVRPLLDMADDPIPASPTKLDQG